MSLVTLEKILSDAQDGQYGVGSVNVVNFEMITSIINAAEKANSPFIIQYAEGDDTRIPIEEIARFALPVIEKASVSICLHLDHGKTISAIKRAIDSGFSSVMIDASDLPYDENVKISQEVVVMAHERGVSVEAEIGNMVNSEYGESTKQKYDTFEESFTQPDIAEKFEKETGADAIAISFGTIHGVYAEKPNLDFDRLKAIREVTTKPLVVHGGSGLANEEYQTMIQFGISKINYYSDMSYRVTKAIMKDLETKEKNGQKIFLQDITSIQLELVEKEIVEKIKIFGSNQ